jgi:hypothetical protein
MALGHLGKCEAAELAQGAGRAAIGGGVGSASAASVTAVARDEAGSANDKRKGG